MLFRKPDASPALRAEAVTPTRRGLLALGCACCLGVLLLRRRGVHESGTPFTSPLTRFAPIAAVALIIWLLSGLSADEWKSIGLLIALLVALYAISVPARRVARVEEIA